MSAVKKSDSDYSCHDFDEEIDQKRTFHIRLKKLIFRYFLTF